MSENPELDYFMNEERSDVVFMIEGQPLPSQKLFLSIKSKVFRAMFSGDYQESKVKIIAIEDTTYEAFKTFIQFLYCDQLVLKDKNDFSLFPELYRLCERYDVSRLEHRITDDLYKKCVTIVENGQYVKVWPQMQWISKIAFEFKIEKLMDKVMEFIDKKLYQFITLDNEVLIELNDSTDGRLFPLMFNKCFVNQKESNQYKEKLKDKVKQLNDLMAKKCKQLNGINESLKKVKSFECDKCGAFNQVKFIDNSTKCKECDQLFLELK